MKGALVVLGATGCVGRAVVRGALEAAWPVIAVAPDAAALDQLKATHSHPQLTVVAGSTADDPSAVQLIGRLRDAGRPIDAVVVCNGSEPVRGRLLDQSTDKLRRTLNEELLPQLIAARELVPLLAKADRRGSYVVVGNPGSDRPWAGYGHRSVAASATRMLLRVLHDEARGLGVRVQLLSVDTPARTDENTANACEQWPSADAIADQVLALLHPLGSPPAHPVITFDPANKPRAVRPPTGPAASDHYGDDPSPVSNLDDTWALLKPFLEKNPS